MTFCPNCGVQVADEAKFCYHCGTQLPERSPQNVIISTPTEEAPASAQPEGEPGVWPVYAQPVYAGPVYAQPKKSGRKWWIVAVIAAIVLIVAVSVVLVNLIYHTFFGREDPNVGRYQAVSAEMWGEKVDLNVMFDGGVSVELAHDGSCIVRMGSKAAKGTWTLEEGMLTLEDDGVTITGTLSDGVMRLENVMGMGVTIVLLRSGDAVEQMVEGGGIDSGWWSGQWYGWWVISSCEGDYEKWENASWDCCAEVAVDGSGRGSMILWDEMNPKANALAELELTVGGGVGEMGKAITGSGYFLSCDLAGGEYAIDPGAYIFDDLLAFEGWYTDGQGSFYFEVYLRPWGKRWDDWLAEDDSAAPYYYERYLEAIENGESMPEDISAAWEKDAEDAEKSLYR